METQPKHRHSGNHGVSGKCLCSIRDGYDVIWIEKWFICCQEVSPECNSNHLAMGIIKCSNLERVTSMQRHHFKDVTVWSVVKHGTGKTTCSIGKHVRSARCSISMTDFHWVFGLFLSQSAPLNVRSIKIKQTMKWWILGTLWYSIL
jgi:hypothetical protein